MKTIHKAAPAVAVMATDITTDSATSFAHSQYDTHAISGRLHCRATSVSGNPGKRQSSLCQSELDARLRRPIGASAWAMLRGFRFPVCAADRPSRTGAVRKIANTFPKRAAGSETD